MNGTPADEVRFRRYQTNVNLNQAPVRAADRPVREYASNVRAQHFIR